MRIAERIRKDREQLKKLSDRSSRAAFIWDYYKIPIIAVMSVIAILLIMFVSSIGRKDASMYVVLLNSDSSWRECDDTVFDTILEDSSIDLKNRTVDINDKLNISPSNETANIETLQILTALFTISDLDLYVADQQYFDYFVEDAGYADLYLLIDKELLGRHQDDLYYVKDGNGNQVLAGIILHEGSPLHEAGYYHGDVIMGIPYRAENMDVAVEFIRLLLESMD